MITATAPADPDLTWDLEREMLARARGVARSIGSRVQEALRAVGGGIPRMRVLVVDDLPDAADALAALLALLGCDVRVAYDGASAVEAAERFRPDVCLLDLVMPGMSGLEVAARVRAGAGARPVLLVATTALGAPDDLAMTAVAGFHHHLVKPVDTAALLDALARFAELAHPQLSGGDPVEPRPETS